MSGENNKRDILAKGYLSDEAKKSLDGRVPPDIAAQDAVEGREYGESLYNIS